MENREMPILHKSQALRQPIAQMGPGNVFFSGTSRQRKNLFLCNLWALHTTAVMRRQRLNPFC